MTITKQRLLTALASTALLSVAHSRGAEAQTDVIDFPMIVEYDVGIPMADGIRLSADVYRPRGEAPVPAMLQLTPYNNDSDGGMEQAWSFVRRGYAYVVVDVRGRYDSDGEFDPWRDDGPDGAQVMDWIASSPWSNGRIATMGGSYSGMNQWLMAKQASPHHAAIVSYVAPADGFNDGSRFNGVPKLDLIFTWSAGMYGRVNQSREGWNWRAVMGELPLHTLGEVAGRPLPYWQEWMEHDRLDEWWDRVQMTGHYEEFDIPSFNVTGWWDGQLIGATRNYVNAVKTGDPQDHMLIIGPWLHGVNRGRQIGVRDYGPEAVIDLDGIRDRWLDHRMLGTPRPDLPRVLYFVQGSNEWKEAEGWPLPETRYTSYFLDSGGQANTLFGDGVLREGQPGQGPPDALIYDPANPVPTISSRTAGSRGGIFPGSQDNRVVEIRDDVLVYTSQPLAEGVEITGPVTATVYFSTDVPDTDITVKLLEVDAAGRALNLTHGIARARYRDGFESHRFLEPGEVTSVEVTLFPTSVYLPSGHRMRVEVSSSNFPLFGRNLNIRGNSETSTETRIAHTRIHHDGGYGTRIVLPLITKPATENQP